MMLFTFFVQGRFLKEKQKKRNCKIRSSYPVSRLDKFDNWNTFFLLLGYADNLKQSVYILATRQGATMSISDLPKKTFYQMVKSLAMMSDSDLNYFISTNSLQVNENLRKLLNTTDMTGMGSYYAGIQSFTENYNFTLEAFLRFVVDLDTPQKSKLILGLLGKHHKQFFMTNSTIASALNITVQNLTMKPYLTDLYPSLKKITPDLLNKTTSEFLFHNPHFREHDLYLTPEMLDGLSHGSVTEGYLLRLELALDLISENHTDLSIIKRKIKNYYDKLLPIVEGYFQRLDKFLEMPLREAKEKCNVTDALFWNLSMAGLGEICLKVHFDIIAGISGLIQRELLKAFTFSRILSLFNVTKEHILSKTIEEVEHLIGGGIDDDLFLHGPIIAEAYKKKIPLQQIPDSTVMGLAIRILNRPELVLKSWFELNDMADRVVTNTTFRNFPDVIKTMYNQTFSVKYMYTVSFVGLMEDIFVRKNITDLKVVFVDTSRHLAEEYTWKQLHEMYSISQEMSMGNTITSFFAKHTSASEKELKNIFELNDKQFSIINKIQLKYASIFLRKSYQDFLLTKPFEVKDKLIALNRDVIILLNSPDQILKDASMQLDQLEKLSIIDLLQKAGRIPMNNITASFLLIKNGPYIFDILRQVPISKFTVPLKMNMSQVRMTKMIELLKKISLFLESSK